MSYQFNAFTSTFDIVSDPSGSDTQVQFNDGGVFGGDSGFLFNKTTDTLTLGNLNLGLAGTGTDYFIFGNGETSTGYIYWMEDEGIWNIRCQGSPYFDFDVSGSPSERSALTINTVYDGAQQGHIVGMACWIKGTSNAGNLYGFFGGYYDLGSSAPSQTSVYGAVGYNYYTGTNSRTISSSVAVQGYNDASSGSPTNLTITEAIGGDFQTPFVGSTATRVYGLKVGATGGSTNWGINCTANIQVTGTNKFGMGKASTTAAINWFAASGANGTDIFLALNSANEYNWTTSAFTCVTDGNNDLGTTTVGWNNLFLKGKASYYNGIITEGSGVPAIVDDVAITGRTTAITTTNFTNAQVAGTYRISYSLQDTTADVTAGAVTLTIAYTDGAGATTKTATQVLTAVGRADGVVYVQEASGNLTYAVAIAGGVGIGTAVYAFFATCERLS